MAPVPKHDGEEEREGDHREDSRVGLTVTSHAGKGGKGGSEGGEGGWRVGEEGGEKRKGDAL